MSAKWIWVQELHSRWPIAVQLIEVYIKFYGIFLSVCINGKTEKCIKLAQFAKQIVSEQVLFP